MIKTWRKWYEYANEQHVRAGLEIVEETPVEYTTCAATFGFLDWVIANKNRLPKLDSDLEKLIKARIS